MHVRHRIDDGLLESAVAAVEHGDLVDDGSHEGDVEPSIAVEVGDDHVVGGGGGVLHALGEAAALLAVEDVDAACRRESRHDDIRESVGVQIACRYGGRSLGHRIAFLRRELAVARAREHQRGVRAVVDPPSPPQNTICPAARSRLPSLSKSADASPNHEYFKGSGALRASLPAEVPQTMRMPPWLITARSDLPSLLRSAEMMFSRRVAGAEGPGLREYARPLAVKDAHVAVVEDGDIRDAVVIEVGERSLPGLLPTL